MMVRQQSAAARDYRSAAAAGLRPPPRVTVSEWADRYRVLDGKSAAIPGQWRTDRVPYLREVMDCLSDDHPAETVVVQASAQVGKTEVWINWAGYTIDICPAPMMLVLPTVDIATSVSKQRVSTLISATPSVREKIGTAKSRDSSNTILNKQFPGGMLLIRGANSAAGLRSTPVQYLALDEIDGYPPDVDGEGDPVDLAVNRTKTFPRRKIFLCSTPTYKEGRIDKAYQETDQRVYMVPCPHCGAEQRMKLGQLKWPSGKPHLAKYQCQVCEDLIPESKKSWMVENGRWVATNPDADPSKVGFHISQLYSLLGGESSGWGKIATSFVEAKRDTGRLKTFVNTVLGEPWQEKGSQPDYEKLFLRRSDYARGTVRADALVLTAGVDVQADRLECEVVGWGEGQRSWSVDYIVIPGDPALDDVWDALDEVLERDWQHELGSTLRISAMAIDSGFSTQNVYKFCRRHSPRRVMAVKGMPGRYDSPLGSPKPQDVFINGKKLKRGATLWPVGVSLLKEELYGWLQLAVPDDDEPTPPGWCEWPKYSRDYFQQLVAETLQLVYRRGRPVYQWVKTEQARNEALDCRVYARAGSIMLGIQSWPDTRWTEIRDALTRTQPVQKQTRADEYVGARDYEKAPRDSRGRRKGDWFD